MAYDRQKLLEEMTALRKYAVTRQAIEREIHVPKIYIDITGDYAAAMVLDEIIYWTLPDPATGKSRLRRWQGGYLWLAVTREEWWDRRRLKPRQVDRAIALLLEENLIFKEVHRWNGHGTTHLRLNVDEFFLRYEKELAAAMQEVEQVEIEDLPEDDNVPVMDIDGQEVPTEECTSETDICTGIVQNNETVTLVSPKRYSNNNTYNNTNNILATSLPTDFSPSGEGKKTGKSKKLTPPEWGVAARIFAGQAVDETVLASDKRRQMLDVAGLIAMGADKPDLARDIALAFMETRGIIFTKEEVSGQRKAINQMTAKHVRPEHIAPALRKLNNDGMTIKDLFSVVGTAINIAVPMPKEPQKPAYRPTRAL